MWVPVPGDVRTPRWSLYWRHPRLLMAGVKIDVNLFGCDYFGPSSPHVFEKTNRVPGPEPIMCTIRRNVANPCHIARTYCSDLKRASAMQRLESSQEARRVPLRQASTFRARRRAS